jgi:hypothetical protein
MLSVLLTSPGSAQVARFDHDVSLGNQAVSYVRYYRGGGYRGYGYRGGYRSYGYRGGYRGYGYGGAAAAGIAGLAIGGAIAAQGAPGYYTGGAPVTDTDAYCRSRYRSYDPASRTYLNNDGNRYPCPSY